MFKFAKLKKRFLYDGGQKKASAEAGLVGAITLEGGVTRRSWERDHVTDVLHAGDVSDQTFEAQTKA